MRYPASEKLEIIRLVERSHLSVRRTLDKLGIAKTTFYRWYDLYLWPLACLVLKTEGVGLVGFGTVSRMVSANRSSTWPWKSRSCRPGN
jgi:hypothetical protein